MDRNHYFDFVRGIAIIMVVGIHTCNRCDFTSVSGIVSLLMREFINVAVPLFLCLSAFFLSRKKFDTKDDCLRFWKKQIPKVYIPCIVWSFPLFIYGLINGKSFLNQVVLLFSGGYGIYYFIPLIIQCYLLLPIATKIGNITLCLIGGGSSLVSAIIIPYMGICDYPFLFFMAPISTWAMFFALGIILGRSKRDYHLSWIIFIVLITFVLQLVESRYLKGYGCTHPFDCTKISSFLYSAAFIVCLFSAKTENWYAHHRLRPVEYIGKISFTIYLVHCYLIELTNAYCPSMPYAIKWSVIVILSTICIYLLRKVVVNQRIRNIVGL